MCINARYNSVVFFSVLSESGFDIGKILVEQLRSIPSFSSLCRIGVNFLNFQKSPVTLSEPRKNFRRF